VLFTKQQTFSVWCLPLPVSSHRLRPLRLFASGWNLVPLQAPLRISTMPSGSWLVQMTMQQPAAAGRE